MGDVLSNCLLESTDQKSAAGKKVGENRDFANLFNDTCSI
jgi:hypothetical protein